MTDSSFNSQLVKDYTLTIKISLSDIDDLSICDESDPNDFIYAVNLWQQDLKATAIARNDTIPDELYARLQNQDELERLDREYAHSASKNDVEKMDDLAKQIASLSFASIPQSPSTDTFFSTTNSEQCSSNIDKWSDCISCFKKTKQKVLCGHYYCDPCVRQVCLTAMHDISFFPARCCKREIVQELIEKSLKTDEFNRYKDLQTSLSSVTIKNLDPEFREMVISHGWKICGQCGAGIEKSEDCNHMTCAVCKYEFCYVCGDGWIPRTCNCDLWNPVELEIILNERAPDANAIERERLRQIYQTHDIHE
ncbi:hypothetical protein HDV02_003900 [Globomyces sp. JEL0801]|nr:hypothetical protein HDV02_003900 [Globomyces sp. JEL0801]